MNNSMRLGIHEDQNPDATMQKRTIQEGIATIGQGKWRDGWWLAQAMVKGLSQLGALEMALSLQLPNRKAFLDPSLEPDTLAALPVGKIGPGKGLAAALAKPSLSAIGVMPVAFDLGGSTSGTAFFCAWVF